MFLLVFVRHVGAYLDGHQHGVSIQISNSFLKKFLRISRIRNIPLTEILPRVFAYLPPFISQFLDFIYWTVLLFIFFYFEWHDTENQQYSVRLSYKRVGHESERQLVSQVVSRSDGHLVSQSISQTVISFVRQKSDKQSHNLLLSRWVSQIVKSSIS